MSGNFRHAQYDSAGKVIDDPQSRLPTVRSVVRNGQPLLLLADNTYFQRVGLSVRALERFDTLSNWTVANNGALGSITQVNNGRGPFGSRGLRFTASVGSGSNSSATKNLRFNQNTLDGFWLVSDVHFQQTASEVGITMFASTAADLASGTGRFNYPNVIPANAVSLQPYWLPKSAWTVLDGSPAWTADMLSIRVRLDSSTTEVRDWSLLGAFAGGARPTVIITLDDGNDSSFTIGHAEARRRGIPLTHYVIPQLFGASGYITLSQAQQMREAGDYLGLHGAQRWDQDISRLRADVLACQAAGIDIEHGSWPEGQTGRGYSWVQNFEALRGFGVKTCRLAGDSRPTLRSIGDPYALNSYPLSNSITLSNAIAAVTTAEQSGGTVIFYGHKFGAVADSLTWVTADWQAFLDHVYQRRLVGAVEVVTIKDWYERAE